MNYTSRWAKHKTKYSGKRQSPTVRLGRRDEGWGMARYSNKGTVREQEREKEREKGNESHMALDVMCAHERSNGRNVEEQRLREFSFSSPLVKYRTVGAPWVKLRGTRERPHGSPLPEKTRVYHRALARSRYGERVCVLEGLLDDTLT